ncbi:hypothetical protein MBCUT_04210 [Methanobrevibacter cuticularis]|uniref:Uncharacterized protein n=1 Tax=Methanobrevibacter cuticularis TaxID=47311 RepID=A0A166EUB4_9EURY|nr:hypothetical protein [Methanobrevibacter cuticularis]KZX17018.1 hypothetical protein MBCUT_04210 [Methanobrevibacter cuticularis]
MKDNFLEDLGFFSNNSNNNGKNKCKISYLDESPNDKNENHSKAEILNFLREINIDTRFISYTSDTLYINNLRFSKFSKKKQEIFEKYYPEIAIVRSTLFQKICTRSSKVLANELSPKNNVLLLKPQNEIDELLAIVIEPYSRKYGIKIIESDFESLDELISSLDKIAIDAVIFPLTLNEQVESILSNIFAGNGTLKDENIAKDKFINDYNINIIFPFNNVSNQWIHSFLDIQRSSYSREHKHSKKTKYNSNKKSNLNNYMLIDKKEDFDKLIDKKEDFDKLIDKKEDFDKLIDKNEDFDKIAINFMEFLDDIIPNYKENILKSVNFIEDNLD